MRRAAQVDRNQAEIVAALRAMGATVQSLGAVGDGCPDLLVGFRALNFLMEVKDGERCPSEQRLNEAQRIWHGTWKGHVELVHSIPQALSCIGARIRVGRPT